METEEINAVIKREVREVDEVITLLVPHPTQRKEQLTSFVVVRSATKRSQNVQLALNLEATSVAAQVLESCRTNLPTYMVPTNVVPLNHIPLSANNKADAKQVKEFFSTLSLEDLRSLTCVEGSERASLSNDEVKIVEVLAKMTGVAKDDISRDSSIFELGLDSITVIGFTRALKEQGFVTAQTSVVMKSEYEPAVASKETDD
jgi:aryl carrier-like protein